MLASIVNVKSDILASTKFSVTCGYHNYIVHEGACHGVFHCTLSLAAEVHGSAGLVSNGSDSFQSFIAIRTRRHSIHAVMVRMRNTF